MRRKILLPGIAGQINRLRSKQPGRENRGRGLAVATEAVCKLAEQSEMAASIQRLALENAVRQFRI